MTNCFSVDVEGFVESNLQSFEIPPRYIDKAREDYEIETNMNVLLGLLESLGIHATFFFVGRIARDLPQIVRLSAQMGHEIGCHSFEHLRIFRLSRRDFKEKLAAAKECLENTCARRVYGFRAPDFSITRAALWALDVLKELNFVYDSSIYPIRGHDVYGIHDAKANIHTLPNGLVEWPLATFDFLNLRLPFGGGGYFRMYPLPLTQRFISSLNKNGAPCMFYIHPYEVGPIVPKIREISRYRYFRHYYNCSSGSHRVKRILSAFSFAPAIQILQQLGVVGHV
ncbi:MAG: polysaccharide deacetylase family protein [Acidobacteria bacterium]|nr:polysaccharide deacetylase family protein [Acidobacteriota bacterium]